MGTLSRCKLLNLYLFILCARYISLYFISSAHFLFLKFSCCLCAVIWVFMSMASSQMWLTASLLGWPRYVVTVVLNDLFVMSSCGVVICLITFDSLAIKTFWYCGTSGQPSDREEGWCHQSCSPLCWGCPASRQARKPGNYPTITTDSTYNHCLYFPK